MAKRRAPVPVMKPAKKHVEHNDTSRKRVEKTKKNVHIESAIIVGADSPAVEPTMRALCNALGIEKVRFIGRRPATDDPSQMLGPLLPDDGMDQAEDEDSGEVE